MAATAKPDHAQYLASPGGVSCVHLANYPAIPLVSGLLDPEASEYVTVRIIP